MAVSINLKKLEEMTDRNATTESSIYIVKCLRKDQDSDVLKQLQKEYNANLKQHLKEGHLTCELKAKRNELDRKLEKEMKDRLSPEYYQQIYSCL